MIRSLTAAVIAAALALSACGLQLPTPMPFDPAQGRPASALTPDPLPSPAARLRAGPSTGLGAGPLPTPPLRAPEIRFALVGEVTDVNVWALFAAEGASYANYAPRWEYWPRLSVLTPVGREIQPDAAEGILLVSAKEDGFYTAQALLRRDLEWTDGSRFTAEDVAFTVNTALQFELGYDWKASYDPDWLARAEAPDDFTVKYDFKQPPNFKVWYFGVLQGPVVQQAYWESKVAEAAILLPPPGVAQSIGALRAEAQVLQADLERLQAELLALDPDGEPYRQKAGETRRKQGDLDAVNYELEQLKQQYQASLAAARAALYALDDADEPTLGAWMPQGWQNGVWINAVNPAFPFGQPRFDRAAFHIYPNEAAAVTALRNNEVDTILSPGGLAYETIAPLLADPAITVSKSQSSSLRFLALNHANPVLGDAPFRRVMGCISEQSLDGIDPATGEEAVELKSFVPPGEAFWYNPDARRPCADLDPQTNFERILEMLKSGGYGWEREPVADPSRPGQTVAPGTTLKTPGGESLTPLTLLASAEDPLQSRVAQQIAQRAAIFGIPIEARLVGPQSVLYVVYSSGQYEMALLGWRVAAYPGYLCEWFGEANPFSYNGGSLGSACAPLNGGGDLTLARSQVFAIQSVLAEDLPFIPLYVGVTYDAYRNIEYPSGAVLNGWSAWYGAPSLAVPAP